MGRDFWDTVKGERRPCGAGYQEAQISSTAVMWSLTVCMYSRIAMPPMIVAGFLAFFALNILTHKIVILYLCFAIFKKRQVHP